jgi:hypothetical protein
MIVTRQALDSRRPVRTQHIEAAVGRDRRLIARE